MNAKDMTDKNRDWALQQGQYLNDQQRQYMEGQQTLADSYRGRADQAYDPLIQGQGGFTPEEKQAMLTTTEDLASNQLTQDEKNQIAGDPWKAYAGFHPGELTNTQDISEERQRGALDDMDRGMGGAANDYGQWGGATLADTRGRLDTDIDKSELSLDRTLGDRYRLTPEQQQDIITKAGITAGTGYRAAAGEMSRRSAAAGIDPAAAASARLRLENASAGAGADAMTSARVMANQEAANREMALERERLNAAHNYSSLRSNADLALSGQTLAEQRDVTNARMGAADAVGRARVGAEQGMNESRQGAQRWGQETGINLLNDIENKESGRAGAIATNRQGINQGNQATRFGQNLAVNEARRGESKEGREYLTGQQGLASSNENQAMNRQVNIYGNENQALGQAAHTRAQADAKPGMFSKIVGTALGAAAGYATGGGVGAVKGAAGGWNAEDGGVVTEPTQATLGERGPEMVVPLGGQERFADGGVVTEPTSAILGEAGPEMVVPLYNNGAAKTRSRFGMDFGRQSSQGSSLQNADQAAPQPDIAGGFQKMGPGFASRFAGAAQGSIGGTLSAASTPPPAASYATAQPLQQAGSFKGAFGTGGGYSYLGAAPVNPVASVPSVGEMAQPKASGWGQSFGQPSGQSSLQAAPQYGSSLQASGPAAQAQPSGGGAGWGAERPRSRGRGGSPSQINSSAPLKPTSYTDYRSRAITGRIGRPRTNPAGALAAA